MTRGLQLFVTFGLVLASCTHVATHAELAEIQTSHAPLRDLAAKRQFMMGAAVGVAPLVNDSKVREILARNYNLITPENELKIKATEAKQGVFKFDEADTILKFAQEHAAKVRGHTLVWHQSLPAWVSNLSPEARRAALQRHIFTVMNHVKSSFPGLVAYWDVVNEAVEKDGKLRSSPWAAIGSRPDEYMEMAFSWAHVADPGALLFYNDFGAEELGTKSDAVYALLKDLKSRGVPIDGVGMQMHFDLNSPVDIDAIRTNMKRLAALGLRIHITELDVGIKLPASAADLDSQAKLYADLLGVCLEVRACEAFVTWGTTDKYSWVPEFFPGFGDALPFSKGYAPKPAYSAMERRLEVDR